MKFIVVASILSLYLTTLQWLPVMGVKEEPDEDILFQRLPANLFMGPVSDLLSIINPDDLYPLCANIATVYDRLLKRGPTFNAWGGKKRASPMSMSHPHLYGKRNNPQSQFNPWGGKRTDVEDEILNRYDKIAAAVSHV